MVVSGKVVVDYELIPAGAHYELHGTFEKNHWEKGTSQQLIN